MLLKEILSEWTLMHFKQADRCHSSEYQLGRSSIVLAKAYAELSQSPFSETPWSPLSFDDWLKKRQL